MHQDRPSSPKRPQSPLRKFNKVAPLNLADKNSGVESKSSLDSPLLTAAKPVVMDTNVTVKNDDNTNVAAKNDDNTACVIANPNVDNNVTFQNEPSTSELNAIDI